MEKLDANGYETDKGIHGLLGIYNEKFQLLKDNEVKLLEIGILKGGSLLMWRDYFKKGIIAGLDCNQVTLDDNTGRVHVYRGFQQDTAILDTIRTECARDGFDIIIDDASHIAELTYYSFWYLFDNHLKPGGIYVIEDWGVGYWDKWTDGKKYYLKLPRDYKRYKVNLIDRFLGYIYKISNEKSPSSKSSAFLRRGCDFITAIKRKKKFKSHEYGMVGLIKQLIDEVGMGNLTAPGHGTIDNWRGSIFKSIEIFPSLVIIQKDETAPLKILNS